MKTPAVLYRMRIFWMFDIETLTINRAKGNIIPVMMTPPKEILILNNELQISVKH